MVKYLKFFISFLFLILISVCKTNSKNITQSNKALLFDGIDDKVDASLKPLKNQWTISLWVKGNDTNWNTFEALVSSSWVSIPEWEKEPLNIRNGYPCIGDNIMSTKKLDENWHHLAAVNNGNSFILYVDGKQEAIGKGGKGTCVYNIATSNDKNFFKGTLDEIRIWNTALTQKTITKWMYKPLQKSHPNYKNLTTVYAFDDEALDATDLTGNINGDIKYYYASKKTTDTPKYINNNNKKFINFYKKSDYLPLKITKNNAFKGLKNIQGNNKLKVLSWNIWHGGVENGVELGRNRVVEIIKASTADVILMIETYGAATYIAKELGYYYYTLGEKDNLCIFSRFPITEFYPSKYNGFYSLGAKIKMPNHKEVIVWDIWLKYALPDYTVEVNRPNYTAKDMIKGDNKNPVKNLQEILRKDIKHYIKDTDVPLIFGGDFNACSHLDWTQKTADAGLHYGKVVDFPVSRIMIKNNFKDSYREVKPDPVKHIGKTWSPILNYCEDFRIDFIYYRGKNIKAIESRVINHHPDKSQMFPSDHAGVLSIFKID